jgi:hypothetical protein
VISTLKQDYFQSEILKAMTERKQKDVFTNGSFIEMDLVMLELIPDSQQI